MNVNDIRLNREEYLDKVHGCWAGKNIGGTLGGPVEGWRTTFDFSFYSQDLSSGALPNDDLDLQLIWLRAMEDLGPWQINERILAEYWMRHIDGPWNEYGIARANIVAGLPPPLSGSVCNDKWKNSNGAWIRSEIWACVFPATPDWACWFAMSDACVDHADDGVYAEIFTAALESAAFVESDIYKLISAGLSRIPEDCRIARAVNLVLRLHSEGKSWLETRNAVVEDSKDLGWFQAPANVAFVIIGLLYGEGDFGKTVCTAVNCGDDTDCTAATAGAIMGIIGGFKSIPQKWLDPIGESIKTIALRTFAASAPKTLSELTSRVAALRDCAAAEHREAPSLSNEPTFLPEGIEPYIQGDGWIQNVCKQRASNRLYFNLPSSIFSIQYVDGCEFTPGVPQRILIHLEGGFEDASRLNLSWLLPEDWSIAPGPHQSLMLRTNATSTLELTITPGQFSDCVEFIPLETRLSSRMSPIYLTIPFALKGALGNSHGRETATMAAVRNGRSNSFHSPYFT